jgi:DNA-binding transcriptional LysR family regulator
MDIELYRTFLAVCDMGSFTAAAQQVGRTQSAVSQQMKRLEDSLGHPLFERRSGAVDLTEYGKSLIAFARSIVETQADVLRAFKRLDFGGMVVIGIADAYVNRIARTVAVEFAKLYPDATLNIVVDGSLDLSRRIADGSVDLAFVTEGNCPTRGQVAFRDRLVLIGPAEGELYKADPLPLVVWDERNQDEAPLIAHLTSLNRGYRIACVCRSVHGQHMAITSGLCAGILVEGSMVPGERAYLEEEGFPIFKELAIRLERSSKKSRSVDRLEQHFLDYFSKDL